MRYDTILFDLDLTLFDFTASERLAFDACANAAGIATSPEVFARYKEINDRLWAGVERGELTPGEAGQQRFVQLLAEVPVGAGPGLADGTGPRLGATELGEMFQAGLGEHGELYPDAGPLLDEMHGRAELGLVTNGLTTVQRMKIDRLGLGTWFDAIVISEEVGVAKPDPAIFDLAFNQLNAVRGPRDRRAQTVMVGDSLSSDMAGARAAGIATCWYNPHRQARPADLDLTYEIHALADLIGVLGT